MSQNRFGQIKLEELLERTSLNETPLPVHLKAKNSAQGFENGSKTTPPTHHSSSQPVTFIHYSSSTLESIRSLSSSRYVLLFTPYIAPGKPYSERCDPFEPLGRALSKYHRNVRHVPYLPRRGLTDEHKYHLVQKELGAIVIVVCHEAGDEASQSAFATQVMHCTTAYERFDPKMIPTALLAISFRAELLTDLECFDLALCSPSYSPSASRKVARLLFRD